MLTELFLNISSSIDLRSSLLNIPSSYFFSSYTTPSSPVTAPTFRSERYPPIHPAHAAIISSSTPSSVPFFYSTKDCDSLPTTVSCLYMYIELRRIFFLQLTSICSPATSPTRPPTVPLTVPPTLHLLQLLRDASSLLVRPATERLFSLLGQLEWNPNASGMGKLAKVTSGLNSLAMYTLRVIENGN